MSLSECCTFFSCIPYSIGVFLVHRANQTRGKQEGKGEKKMPTQTQIAQRRSLLRGMQISLRKKTPLEREAIVRNLLAMAESKPVTAQPIQRSFRTVEI